MNPSHHQVPVDDSAPLSSHPLPLWKRALDIVAISLAIPLLAPVVACVALIIKITSPGPLLFKQARVGIRGKQFLCFKFRTMKVNADTTSHQDYLQKLMGSNAPMVKMDARGDTRLIPGGWLVRALGLDELPQLINVLRGEMSLVGPRPCIPYEYNGYLPWQKERFASVPGLTGLWQVSGKNKTTFDEMIRLDIRYAYTKSMLLDLKIILMTGPAVLQQVLETRLSRQSSLKKAPAHPAPVARPSTAHYLEKTLTS